MSLDYKEIKPSEEENQSIKTSTSSIKGTEGQVSDENLVRQAVVMKRNRWYFFQDRKIILTNEPRLMYYKKGVYRSDITLTKDMKVET